MPKRPTLNTRSATENDRFAGQLLKILRKNQGVSQTALADMAGISFQQLQKYEKGTNRISVGRMITLCQSIGIETSKFIARVEKEGREL